MSSNFLLTRSRLWRTRAATALAAAGALVMSSGLVMLSSPTASGAEGRAGNNGTVKIDGADLKDGADGDNQDNEPFVPCTFTIQWYNYTLPEDSGDSDVDYTVDFQLKDPTEAGRQFTVDPDDAGSFVPTAADQDKDFEKTYQLYISGPPMKQGDKHGYHVKVVVTTEYSKGNDVKHKVFWTQGCQPGPETDEVSDDMQSCDGVFHRTGTVTKEYVWDDENGWVLEPESGWTTNWGDWVKVRDLTEEESLALHCDRPDQPEPLVRVVPQSEESCDLGGVRTWNDVYTTEYVFNEETWQWELGQETGPVVQDENFVPYTAEERAEKGCDEILGTEKIAPEVTFQDPTCAKPNRTTWSGNLTDLVDYAVSGTPGRGKSVTVTASIKPEVADEFSFPEGYDNTFEHSYPTLEDLQCVKGTESSRPKPSHEPTVLGTSAVVPTAVDAGVAGTPTSSPGSLLAQLMVAGGLVLLLAGGWVGFGRREYGAREA